MPLHANEMMPLVDSQRRVFGKAANYRTATALIEAPVTLNACETDWTADDLDVSVDHPSTPTPRAGSYVSEIAIGETFAASGGLAAHAAVSSVDMSTRTHLLCEIQVTADLPAGAIQIGIDDASDGATSEWLDVPALAADTWYTLQLPLSAAIQLITDADAVALNVVSLTGAVTIYLDNIRAAKITCTGDAPITLPSAHTVGNDGTDIVELLAFPFESSALSSNPMPMDVTLMPFRGETAGYDATSDEAMGHMYVFSSDYLDEARRSFTSVAIARSTELTGNDKIVLEVIE